MTARLTTAAEPLRELAIEAAQRHHFDSLHNALGSVPYDEVSERTKRIHRAQIEGTVDAVLAAVCPPVKPACVHCGDELGQSLAGGGLFVHTHGLQRCQADAVPYGHMGHPSMPCPPEEINPCAGYREAMSGGVCTHHTAARPTVDRDGLAEVLAGVGCPTHRMRDCSPMLNGCSWPSTVRAQADAVLAWIGGQR